MTHRRGALVLLVVLAGGCGSRAVPEVRCVDGWCALPAGSFSNYYSPGSLPGLLGDWTVTYPRYVRLTRGFEIAQSETTQARYDRALERGLPSGVAAPLPVSGLSWHDAANYCNALSRHRGVEPCYRCVAGAQPRCETAAQFGDRAIYDCQGYRLPTVAEWMYAYRAGSSTFYYSGTPGLGPARREIRERDPGNLGAFERLAGPIGWHKGNSGGRLQPSMQKAPNRWGLYDMAGNAKEWAHDRRLQHQHPAAHYPRHGSPPDPTATEDIDPVHVKTTAPAYPKLSALLGGSYMGSAESLGYLGRAIALQDQRVPSATVRCVRTLPNAGP